MVEKYILYNQNTNTVYDITDTEEEIRSACRLSTVFRKMVNKDSLQMAKALLSEEEIEKFNKGEVLKCEI